MTNELSEAFVFRVNTMFNKLRIMVFLDNPGPNHYAAYFSIVHHCVISTQAIEKVL